MKVLLIDDDLKKITMISSFLESNKIEKGKIITCQYASEARKILSSNTTIDLMLIDVLLPNREGSQPSATASIELLKEIFEDQVYPTPSYTIGITSSYEALQCNNSAFSQLVTSVLHVSPEVTEWKNSLRTFINNCKRIKDQENYLYDIAVINALRKPELEQIYRNWPLILQEENLFGTNTSYKSGKLSLKSKDLSIVCTHLSGMGPIISTHTTECLLQHFKPKVVIMTGICGGFSEHVAVGDVIIAEKSWDWQAGKWVDDWSLQPATDPKDASFELVALAKTLDSEILSIYNDYPSPKPQTIPKLVSAPMVTGSSVVANRDIQQVFKGQHRKMSGIDMECFGLYYSCTHHFGIKPKFICIKAVSDLADREKEDNFQHFCSYMSAQIGLRLIEKFFSK